MTWAEFKAEIDRQLADQGMTADTPIWYIDVSYPSRDPNDPLKAPVIALDTNGDLAITCAGG